MKEPFTLYMVMNNEGKFMRAKGYGGGGDSWVDSIETARIYTKIGPAKTQVTFWGSHFPEFEPPKLVVLSAKIEEIIDRAEYIEKFSKTKKKKEEEHKIRVAKDRIKRAETEVERAKQKLIEIDGIT